MLKKILLSLLLSVSLVGCSQVTDTIDKANQTVEQVNETVNNVNKVVEVVNGNSLTIEVPNDFDGKVLMELLKANHTIDEKDGFINSVDGLVADASKKEFLAIYHNGEMATVGANDLVLKSGDKVEFKVEIWQ